MFIEFIIFIIKLMMVDIMAISTIFKCALTKHNTIANNVILPVIIIYNMLNQNT